MTGRLGKSVGTGCRGVVGWIQSVAAAASMLIAVACSAHAEGIVTHDKRVALVIGISKYQNAPALANPGNDARRVAEALRRLNFDVEEAYDADYRTLSRALRAFGIRAAEADAALIFFAGHGVQVDHENYLLPADAKLERQHDLLYEALSLDLFLGEISQAKTVGILLLDACRNNPFIDRMSRGVSIAGRATTVQKGLARVDQVPRNTIVAMATRADELAEDGSGENSPFTQALLAHLQIPGLELSLFFRSVRDTVLKATKGRQEPYVFSSLGAEPFYFYPRPPNRPPIIGPIAKLELSDVAGPTSLGVPRPSDPDDDPLTVRVVGLPQSGEIRIDGKQVAANDVVSLEKFMTATYKPDGKMHGQVGTFDFLVEDGRGGSVMGSVPIVIAASNRPPVVEPDRTARIYPGALAIAPPTDPDNDPLTVTITGLPNRGTVRNGSAVIRSGDRLRPQELAALIYNPEPGAVGDVGSLRYVVDDGRGGKAEGRLQIEVAPTEDTLGLFSEGKLWHRVSEEGDIAAVQSFLKLFPDSRYAAEAHQREQELLRHGTVAAAAPLSKQPPEPAKSPAPSLAMDVPPPTAPSPATARPPIAAVPSPPPAVQERVPVEKNRRGAESHVAAANTLSPPAAIHSEQAIFKDCRECPSMVQIAAGSFIMGQASGDPTAAPAHTVTIRRFAIGQRPISVGEWKACVAEGGCASIPHMIDADERAPMHNLSWDDAQRYVSWLSKKTGHHYRLPSEAEWEYAARAKTATRYWWGDQIGVGLANCADCGGKQEKDAPLFVDVFKPNPFGLLGVHGGVAQWVADCWYPNYQGAPADGGVRDRKNCESRVLRGGSFRNDHNNITSAVRNYYDASVRYTGNGFRVAADLD